jgi:hypothetical protein
MTIELVEQQTQICWGTSGAKENVTEVTACETHNFPRISHVYSEGHVPQQ